MFTLLMANIQGETLICVSNSDREDARAQLHLQDRDSPCQPFNSCCQPFSGMCPGFLGPNVGFICDDGPRSSAGTAQRLCHTGRGQEAGDRGGPCVCSLSSALSLMVVSFFI